MGARARLGEKFQQALADDFDQHGDAVIKIVRSEDPGTYLSIVAKLQPREVEAKLQVAHAIPAGLHPEDWARLVEILAMVRRIAPPGTSPDAAMEAIELALRSKYARTIEHAPSLAASPAIDILEAEPVAVPAPPF